ncbi:MAG: hypothetical protein NC084_08285 [Bacteroides sp.]|nr:hypothetical protein [Eubacterium sp.]MCM1418640.1 hypothetical protein [Roseburia sp.]MCM1462694.1 hypothetical protein [Bacteroides sp.]
MKRFLFGAFLLAGCSALCACTTVLPPEAPELDRAFSATAEIRFGKENCKAVIKRFAEKDWELYVTEPYAIEGLIVTIRDGETSLSMVELEGFADLSEEAVSTAKLISDAFDAAKDGTVSKSGDTIMVTGDSENAHYTLTLDVAGAPSELSLSGRSVSVKLADFAELPIEEQRADEEEASDETFVSVE